jgi:hypothetical protein
LRSTILNQPIRTSPSRLNWITTLRIAGPIGILSLFTVPQSVSAQPPGFSLRINSGGPAYAAWGGSLWGSDVFYSGGSTAGTTLPIFNTTNQPAYKDARYGTFSYSVPNIPNGNYTVILHFAELNMLRPGQRVFDVSINDQPVLTSFDIVNDVGSNFDADDKTFPVTVTNNLLAIQFSSIVNDAQVNGIEIMPAAPSIGPPPGGGGGPPAGAITSCREITKPGSYVLGSNLNAAPGATCLNIHDVSGVQLDCRQFSVSIDINNDPSLAHSAISVANASNYSIANCKLQTLNTTVNKFALKTLSVTNSPQGTIANNSFTGGYVNIGNSNGLRIAGNSSNTSIEIYTSDNLTIEKNQIVLDPIRLYPGAIILSQSNGTKIQNNQMSGGWDGIQRSLNDSKGADDGIAFGYLSNSTIQGNTITNVWDCALENYGVVDNVQILNNHVTKAGICGFGGWYYSSWKNSTMSGNTVEQTYYLFDFYRLVSLVPGEQFVYFLNNTFSNNKLVNQTQYPGYVIDAAYVNFANLPDGIPAGSLVVGNNVFADNDFGTKAGAPFFTPASMISDGGGNVCGTQNQTADFPLRCISPTVTSCPGPAIGAFTGCYYGNVDLIGTPVMVRTDSLVAWDWFNGSPGTALQIGNFSVRWQGNFTFDAGNYTFQAITSDGMRLYIDGTMVLDRWRDQSPYLYAVPRTLSQGTHLITVEYYDHSNGGTAHLTWQKTSS